jgi:ABC-type molybdate transport system substrate-binding protein
VKGKLIIVAVFALAVIGIILFQLSKGGGSAADPAASGSAAGSSSSRPPPVQGTEISMLYSTEKKEWIEAALVTFQTEHPEIKVKLVGKGSLAAAQAIVDDKEKPTVFSPADTLVLNLASSDWKTKGRGDLFAASGDDAPQSLVITPLVFVIWEDRAEALLKSSKGSITWKSLHKAIASNQGWPAVGGKPAWGFVKLGHTDPTQSNSGLQALYLMSLEYYGKPSVEIGDLLKPDYQTFVKEVEKGVSKFEASTGTFMTEMVRFGPSKYDVAVVYENLAVSEIEHAQGRWGNLRVYYPQTTLWSDHPAALVQADWVTPAQKSAARVWIAHLRSRAVQERALSFGFRPGDPAVPVKTGDAQNPYTRLAQYGIQVDIPPVAKAPDGAVVRNLMTMWSRIVAPAQ